MLPVCCWTGSRAAARKSRALWLPPRPSSTALGDGVHHLDATLVGGGDEAGDVGERARRAGGGGEFGQGAVRSHDALLALDGQQDGGGGVEQFGEPLL